MQTQSSNATNIRGKFCDSRFSQCSSLGLANGDNVIGQRDNKVEGSTGVCISSSMSGALDRFENGIMMVSKIARAVAVAAAAAAAAREVPMAT